MADLSYDVQVNTSQAERNLSNLQKSVGGLNDTFIRLKSTLATISLGAVISQAFQFADAIQDLSDATGIATNNILGFSNAVMASGGDADTAQKGILKLVQSIGDAAAGSLEAQNSFRAVGVSLGDLAKLSEQELLKKTIDGLDKITNSAERSTLVAKLLGKEFRNVTFGNLGAAYATAAAESQKYNAAIQAGAAAQQNIDATLKKFQTALLDVLKPISTFIADLNVSIDTIKRFITALISVGVAIATWTYAGRIITALRVAVVLLWDAFVALFGAARNIGTFLGELSRGMGALWRSTEGAGGVLARLLLALRAVGGYIVELLQPALTALTPLMKPLFVAGAAAAGYMSDKVFEVWQNAKGLIETLSFGLIKFGNVKPGEQADVRRVDNALEEQTKKERDALREVQDALQKRRLEIQKASTAFKEQNNQVIDNINLEKSFIGKTEDFIEIERAREEVFKRAADESNKLREAKKLLTKDEQALAAVYDQQIAKIVEASGKDAERIARSVEGLQGLRLVENARKQDIENTTKAIEDQISRQQQLGDILRGINDQRVDITFQQGQKGKSPFQQQIDNIRENARKAALEAGRAYAAAFEDSGDGLTPERAAELANGLNAIATAYRDIAMAQVEALGSSNDMIRGLTEAWDSYKAAALDTAGQIKSNFENFTSGLEDAFVNFVQTGKLSFKSLANSILADLARIAFKKAVLGMAGLFGFAAGGSVMGGTPIIVGERGPELFVPSSAGKIVPNNVLNGSAAGQGAVNGQGQTVVNYNIQAVDAASFRSLVARDPSFIYAVTEQGRRSQPTRSR